MPTRVDSHVHVFPDPFKNAANLISADRISQLSRQARTWAKPITGSAHRMQTMMRHLPEFARHTLDELGAVVPLPGLLVESTAQDLLEAMRESGIDYSVVIAHPPLISNEFVLELAQEHPELFAVVNLPKDAPRPSELLRSYVKQGAKALKIHPAADGEGVQSTRYKKLLKTAQELGIPVIIHTGCIHSRLIYKDVHQSRAELFKKWYESYPDLKFILAHMNYHEPQVALDLCEKYENLFVDTSWQPAEVIGEAVRRMGAERILFGSDWPLVGSNMKVGRQRIDECIEIGILNENQAQLILGENACKLLGLKSDAIRTQSTQCSSD